MLLLSAVHLDPCSPVGEAVLGKRQDRATQQLFIPSFTFVSLI